MSVIATLGGIFLVVAVLTDVVNTLVTTRTSRTRWWLTVVLYTTSWRVLRAIGSRLGEARKETLYAAFAPLSVIGLLIAWTTQQVIGFGLIWWGIGGVDGAAGLGESIYYSGVVYFTLGFGEVVPVEVVPRFGSLIEALSGVLTTALVIGYLPALYSAYLERERQLLLLDDGSEDRITPTNLVLAKCPDRNPGELDDFFRGWEEWVAMVMETHTTFRMLVLFRSSHRGQHWITALGLVTDAALHLELTRDGSQRSAYWMLRRSIRLFQTLTEGVDLRSYREQLDRDQVEDEALFTGLYRDMEAAGFVMLPFDEARQRSRELRRLYDAEMEYLIDFLDAPRGFWGHEIGVPLHPKSPLL